MRIYTKTGDSGSTGLFTGRRVPKCSQRIEAYGAIDELLAIMGLLSEKLANMQVAVLAEMRAALLRNQELLFSVGSELACDGKIPNGMYLVAAEDIQKLEVDMDTWEKDLPPLRTFVLPGGCELNAWAHLARTTCRRAERELVRLRETEEVRAECLIYLNRLSDWFFMASRAATHALGAPERTWQSGRTAASSNARA